MWNAGRAAAAIRTSVLSCLLAMLQSRTLSKEQVKQTHTGTFDFCFHWVGTGSSTVKNVEIVQQQKNHSTTKFSVLSQLL